MQLSKSSFVVGNIVGSMIVGVIAVACGGGGGGNEVVLIPPTTTTPGEGVGAIKASSVIVRSGTQTASISAGAIIRVQANQLPENVKVEATNVTLVNAANDLQSTDLQAALDKEIAVNIPKALIGTWDVENNRANGCGQTTGKVTINADGTITLISGAFSAAMAYVPTGEGSCKYTYLNHSYRVYGDGAAISVAHSGYSDPQFPNSPGSETVALILKPTLNKMTITNTQFVSVLTRSAVTPTSLELSPATKSGKGQLVALSSR